MKEGESICGKVSQKEGMWMALVTGQEPRSILSIHSSDGNIWGEVEADKVRVTCVPKDNPLVRKYLPDLPELEYKP